METISNNDTSSVIRRKISRCRYREIRTRNANKKKGVRKQVSTPSALYQRNINRKFPNLKFQITSSSISLRPLSVLQTLTFQLVNIRVANSVLSSVTNFSVNGNCKYQRPSFGSRKKNSRCQWREARAKEREQDKRGAETGI